LNQIPILTVDLKQTRVRNKRNWRLDRKTSGYLYFNWDSSWI